MSNRVLRQLERSLTCVLQKKTVKKIVKLLFVCPQKPYRILPSFKTLAQSVCCWKCYVFCLCFILGPVQGPCPSISLEYQAGRLSDADGECGTGGHGGVCACMGGERSFQNVSFCLRTTPQAVAGMTDPAFWIPGPTSTSKMQPFALLSPFLLAGKAYI